MNETPDPRAALDAIRDARGELRRSLDYPLYWDFISGLPVAAIVAGQALDGALSSVVLVFAMLGVILMMNAWRNHFGWWVSGYSPRKARWVAIGMVVLILPLMAVSLWTRFGEGAWWWPLVAGGLAWAIMGFGGRVWIGVYRRELEDTGA